MGPHNERERGGREGERERTFVEHSLNNGRKRRLWIILRPGAAALSDPVHTYQHRCPSKSAADDAVKHRAHSLCPRLAQAEPV